MAKKEKSIADKSDKEILLDKYRSMGKIKKPKKPNYTKKPLKTASLEKQEKWIADNLAKKAYYELELSVYAQVRKEKADASKKIEATARALRF
jgi:hypothetical protein